MPRSSSRLPLLLIALLGGMLVVLAVLQWRWIGQWSAVEEARRRSALQAGAEAFDLAFTTRLDELAGAFGEIETGDDGAADSLRARLAAWRSQAPDERLLAAVYWVAPGPEPRLLRFDGASGALRPQAWPPALAPWRAFFARHPSGVDLPPPGQALTYRVSDQGSPGAPLGLALPALPPPTRGTAPVRFVLVLLDEAHVQTRVLPALLREHFDAQPYDLLMADRSDPAQVLYRSDAALAPDAFTAPDLDYALGPNAFSHLQVDLVSSQAGAARHDVAWLNVLPTPRPSSGRWRLLAQHEAGSIGAAVARLRHRQLGLAFGVLFVLGAATALLVRSVQKQRRLAQQQMAFVAGVTHELRTPLAVIRSAGENLADGVVADPAQARRYGALVRDESDRLGRLVEGVLALAGADTRARTPERLDLRAVVGEAVAQARPVLDETGTALAVEVPDGLPPLDGDAAGLATALRNLLVNAARYGGPNVALAARAVIRGGTPAVALTVEDGGPGLDAADLPHLFEPFYRGAAAPKHTGAGLGLALVRRTAEAHGGAATAENAPGGGARFTLLLPTAEDR